VIYEQVLGSNHPHTRTVRRNLVTLDSVQETREDRIARIAQEAAAAVATALASRDTEERTALAERLEARARWAEEGEVAGPPYLELATRLRELKGHLERIERALDHVSRLVPNGDAADRADYAERFIAAAETYEHGRTDVVTRALATRLRELAAQLTTESDYPT
jgi:hypothetical protein